MADFDAIIAQFEKAQTHHAHGRFAEALGLYDAILNQKPDLEEAHCNKAGVLQDMGRTEEALASLDRAIAINPALAEAHNNRGLTLQNLERPGDALASFDRAIALLPDFAEAHNNRGFVLQRLGRLDEAITSYDRAVACDPAHVGAHWNKALRLLAAGRFEEGLQLYEWRKKRPRTLHFYPALPKPLWLGKEDIRGQRLLLHAEQGLGDTLMFCRYALWAEQKGARVNLVVQERLVRLVRQLSSGIQVTGFKSPLPACDFYTPLLSMPLACGTNPHTVPAAVPYLRAEPERMRAWRDRIGSKGLRIGIAWQGNSQAEEDAGRSLPVSNFEILSQVPGVRLISLHKQADCGQLADLPGGMRVESLGEAYDAGPDGFIDAAAVMENLDLIITSDTSIAHLAGALGRPVWVALQQVPDWRWLLDREDSPWYPSMTLFRQTTPGDWSGVFAAMRARLEKLPNTVQSGA